ncbi:class I SAM-dependent methyltransferase [Aliarcobacter cryaerophilus]|uniref:class I SAM-dependent methyltransferase n=1 Tax=Aliarcobacter cryaerophilus TaxID=28198 RepID=UPI000824C45E|nr:class I SAM-dependent methyltransferase [Aliarcobacter cryaerophilus]
MSYHLANINKQARFTLVDYLEEAVKIAKDMNIDNKNRFSINTDNIYELKLEKDKFDFVFCWQTLSWLDNPKEALLELIKITKPKGKIYLSSLFNLEHDVDIFSKVYDRSMHSGKSDSYSFYNTYSEYTVKSWLKDKVDSFKIHKFETPIPFEYDGRGLGTYTKKCEDGYIQISAGMLMNWGILEITK